MHAARTARPVTTLRTKPLSPDPQWEGLFVEPQYPDGQPYNADPDGLEDDEYEAA